MPDTTVPIPTVVSFTSAPRAENAAAPVLTILVVDDDPAMLKLVGTILRGQGYDVCTALNREEAWGHIDRRTPGLILLDYCMPEVDGVRLCREMRRDLRLEDAPILFLTAMTDPQQRADAFSAGAVDYITKPVDRAELVARVRTHHELAQSRAQLRWQAARLKEVVAEQSGRLEEVRCGQATMLSHTSSLGDLRAAVRFQPAHEAGGDFYEVLRLSDDDYGFFIADVSGHDLGVAYLTGALKALVLSFASEVLSVTETMVLLNASLGKFFSPGHYATACYARYSRARQALDVIAAGHPPAIIRTHSGEIRVLGLVGDVLGVYEQVTQETRSISVSRGDRLFLYTDGLIEDCDSQAPQGAGRAAGLDRLIARIQACGGADLDKVIDTVVDAYLQRYEHKIRDDIVLLGVEF